MQEAQAQAQRGGEILASALATGCLDAASQLSSWLPTSSREDTSSAVLGCVMSCIRSLRESGELHTRCSEYTRRRDRLSRADSGVCMACTGPGPPSGARALPGPVPGRGAASERPEAPLPPRWTRDCPMLGLGDVYIPTLEQARKDGPERSAEVTRGHPRPPLDHPRADGARVRDDGGLWRRPDGRDGGRAGPNTQCPPFTPRAPPHC